ncbi:MAG TPA: phospholipase D family protein [Phycisphaerae bacterium]|nr:phospholipase D family protein [Phycisphaerae bacterium]HRW56072.1 phospholipase D family protein [Phycisphaerae bacterium]
MRPPRSTTSTRRFLLLATCLATLFALAQTGGAMAGPKQEDRASEIDVVFSPDGGCASRIITEIETAKKSIHVQAYIFTSDAIAKALIEAAERDIDVSIIFDASQKKQRYSKWRKLKQGGVKVRFDEQHATANNKIILIDSATVITGSYNYSKAAESRNAENVVIIRNDRRVFARFRENFESHWDHSD